MKQLKIIVVLRKRNRIQAIEYVNIAIAVTQLVYPCLNNITTTS